MTINKARRILMRRLISTALSLTLLAAASPALARKVTVEITNLTNAIYYTPLLIVAHSRRYDVFEVGRSASASLQKMAEGGDIADLAGEARAAGAVVAEDPAGGILAPGKKAKVELDVERSQKRLSLVAMMLPTNDGFVGLDSIALPKIRGTQTVYLLGYDAGTEANDEVINGGGAPGTPGIPADPGGLGGSGGSGVTDSENNTKVHVHRNIIGDTDPGAGISDLDSRAHRWLNPVARVVIKTRSPE
jgi:hypothetical protein